MSSPMRARLRVGLSLLAWVPLAACGGSGAAVRTPGGAAGQAGMEMAPDAGEAGAPGGDAGGAAGAPVAPPGGAAGSSGTAGSGPAPGGAAGSGTAGSGAAGSGAAGRTGLLNGGPYWDYNFALGIGNATSISPTPVTRSGGTSDPGWEYQINATSRQGNVNSWFPILMTDPAFTDQVAARWSALRADLLAPAAVEARLQALAAQLPADALARDAARWPLSTVYGTQTGMTGSVAWVKSTGSIAIYGPAAATWSDQVHALHDFVLGRADWIDSQW